MPQTNTATGHITPSLHKLNASRIAIIKHKNNAKSPKHSCKTNPQKKCHGKHHRMPQIPALATNTQWIDYKICTLIYKCCNKPALVYLQNLIQEKSTTHPGLRSEHKKALLAVPEIGNQTLASRSFSIYVPKLWNSLPDTMREEIIFKKFKNKLKTPLFTTAYM